MSQDPAVDERVSLAVVTAALIAIVVGGMASVDQWSRLTWEDRVGHLTNGTTPTVALALLVAVLVIVLGPGDEIGATGRRALRLAVVLGAVTVVGTAFNVTSQAAFSSTFQWWTLNLIPRSIAIIPAGVAFRLANDALRGA